MNHNLKFEKYCPVEKYSNGYRDAACGLYLYACGLRGKKRQRVDMWNYVMCQKESELGLNTAVNEPHVNTLNTSFHFAFIYLS